MNIQYHFSASWCHLGLVCGACACFVAIRIHYHACVTPSRAPALVEIGHDFPQTLPVPLPELKLSSWSLSMATRTVTSCLFPPLPTKKPSITKCFIHVHQRKTIPRPATPTFARTLSETSLSLTHHSRLSPSPVTRGLHGLHVVLSVSQRQNSGEAENAKINSANEVLNRLLLSTVRHWTK